MAFLKKNAVSSGIHYPVPVHRTSAYFMHHSEGQIAISERIADDFVSLPIYSEMSQDSVQGIADLLALWVKKE
jgi:dTDP-4-amino-4,6-dideoxygalactose transaminase